MLMTRCLAGDSCRVRYFEIVRDMADLVEGLALPIQADAMHAQIAVLVDEDPRKEIDTPTFEAVFADERAFLADRPAVVRSSLP